MVGAIHTGGVVQRVGVDPPAGQIEFDATQCRDPKVAAFANDLGAHLVRADPHGIVGAVTDIGIRLRLGLDIGPDAAVEQQIHRGLQNRPDQVGRGHLGDVTTNAKGIANLVTDRDGLLLAAVYPRLR